MFDEYNHFSRYFKCVSIIIHYSYSIQINFPSIWMHHCLQTGILVSHTHVFLNNFNWLVSQNKSKVTIERQLRILLGATSYLTQLARQKRTAYIAASKLFTKQIYLSQRNGKIGTDKIILIFLWKKTIFKNAIIGAPTYVDARH